MYSSKYANRYNSSTAVVAEACGVIVCIVVVECRAVAVLCLALYPTAVPQAQILGERQYLTVRTYTTPKYYVGAST